ncbi:MAG: response regulator transcription factor, partial [Thermomicrobiales bacterium]
VAATEMNNGLVVVARLFLGSLARAQGDTALAWAQVRLHLPLGPATAPGNDYFQDSIILQRLAAALATDAGDLPLAREWLAAHDRWLAWSGAVLGQAEGQLGWAEYYRAAGDLSLAREHADRALAHATEPRQPLPLLATHRLLGELATAMGAYAEAQPHLAAALALAAACAAPYERALCLLALADLRAAIGDRDGAQAALAEARTMLEPLGAKPALARADALAVRLAAMTASTTQASAPNGLSAREVEVLRLVAQGLSDAQVAERLYLSPRTVGTHLRAVYNKLGVDNRTAAAHWAAEHGLT